MKTESSDSALPGLKRSNLEGTPNTSNFCQSELKINVCDTTFNGGNSGEGVQPFLPIINMNFASDMFEEEKKPKTHNYFHKDEEAEILWGDKADTALKVPQKNL